MLLINAGAPVRRAGCAAALAAAVGLGGCGDDAAVPVLDDASQQADESDADTTDDAPADASREHDADLRPVKVVAVGDIAGDWPEDDATAALAGELDPAAILLMGDLAYDTGTPDQFADYFEPSWGRHKDIIYPTPGNHDHGTEDLAGYCGYFGDRGNCRKGYSYQSFDLGAWHIVALDSGCSSPASCPDPAAPGSTMRRWLADDLAANDRSCTLAYFHHPRFSSGDHGNNARMDDLWEALHAGGVDLVLTGHDHNYERFEPLDASGEPDPDGMVQFVVGTGGIGLRSVGDTEPTSAVADDTSHGVLDLTLEDGRYEFAFVPVEGDTFTDEGSGSCR